MFIFKPKAPAFAGPPGQKFFFQNVALEILYRAVNFDFWFSSSFVFKCRFSPAPFSGPSVQNIGPILKNSFWGCRARRGGPFGNSILFFGPRESGEKDEKHGFGGVFGCEEEGNFQTLITPSVFGNFQIFFHRSIAIEICKLLLILEFWFSSSYFFYEVKKIFFCEKRHFEDENQKSKISKSLQIASNPGMSEQNFNFLLHLPKIREKPFFSTFSPLSG